MTEIKTQFINCTPHAIVVENEGQKVTIEPSGFVARVSQNTTETVAVCGFRLFETAFGAVELPAQERGKVFICSAIALTAAKAAGRTDCCAPLTDATATRNEKGFIESVRGFVC
jgi:hypothetical protein